MFLEWYVSATYVHLPRPSCIRLSDKCKHLSQEHFINGRCYGRLENPV